MREIKCGHNNDEPKKTVIAAECWGMLRMPWRRACFQSFLRSQVLEPQVEPAAGFLDSVAASNVCVVFK